VKINLKNNDDVLAVVREMQQKFSNKKLNYFIQKYHPKGLELIIGAKAEKGLGHLLMFGMGGVYVEILKDVTFELTPVTYDEALYMINNIIMSPLLNGYRGEEGINKNSVIEIIQKISQLVTVNPEIQELDLNPLLAFKDKLVVVDARISI
jgi:acetyltransferase